MPDIRRWMLARVPAPLLSSIHESPLGTAEALIRGKWSNTDVYTLGDGRYSLKIPKGSTFAQIVQNRKYEPLLTDSLQSVFAPGQTFYDVGAQFGYFGKIALKEGVYPGEIYAFEANKYNYQFLKSNLPDSHCYREWVGAADMQHIDEYTDANPPPSVIKIDVEGGEKAVIEGGKKTLETNHPRLFIEMHPQFLPQGLDSVRDITSILDEFGYNLEVADHREGDGWMPIEQATLPTDEAFLVDAKRVTP